MTLAPAFGQALPSLAQVPDSYSHEFQAELVYEVCSALVREGLGTPEHWEKCHGDVLVFAQNAIMSAIGEDRWNLLNRNVNYHLTVSDVAERDFPNTALHRGQLVVTINCSGAGYLKIGPALAALEAEAEGLGAAFYWTLTYGLYRVMRIYNHDEALQYEEGMRECAEQDDDESRTQYEFPEVEKALPECVRKTLTKGALWTKRHDRRLLRRCLKGQYGSWIERVRRIDCIARVRTLRSIEFLDSGYYDSDPLPSLLVTFRANDAIEACFDEDSQSMMEGSAEPALAAVFSPCKPDEVRNAIRTVRRFLAVNEELFRLVEDLREWEKSDGSEYLDRREPSLQAA